MQKKLSKRSSEIYSSAWHYSALPLAENQSSTLPPSFILFFNALDIPPARQHLYVEHHFSIADIFR